MSLSILLQARRDSTRVQNKMLREFGWPGESLFSICCRNIAASVKPFDSSKVKVCVAAYEEEFFDIADKIFDDDQGRVVRIQRSFESAHSDDAAVVDSFYDQIPSDHVLIVSACCPLLSITTIARAIVGAGEIKSGMNDGFMSVVEVRRWLWSQDCHILNDNPDISSTQQMRPFFVAANALYAFSKSRYIATGYKRYWSFGSFDPVLFVISQLEAFDVDTEDDFVVAEAMWKRANWA